MACTAQKTTQTAIGEIGYQETPKGSNKNKYADYIDKNFPNFYNGKKGGGGVPWCEVFVDYCILTNSSNEEEAEYVLCQPKKSAGAGCPESYDYYKKAKRTGSEPKLGAQIYFGSDEPKHTGLVVDISGDSVITVEGNSEDQVKRHTYKKTSSRIYGYGYPRYAEESGQTNSDPEPETPATPPESPEKSIQDLAAEVIAGKWGNNPERKQRLTEAGYDYEAVQAEVNRILKGTASTPAPAPVPDLSTKKYKVKTNSGKPLRLRSLPNTDSKILALLPNGTSIQGTEEHPGWIKTTFNGKTGYCSKKYLV